MTAVYPVTVVHPNTWVAPDDIESTPAFHQFEIDHLGVVVEEPMSMTDEESKDFFFNIGRPRGQAKRDVYVAAYGGQLQSGAAALQRFEELVVENAKLKDKVAKQESTIRNLEIGNAAAQECADMLCALETLVWRDARTQSYRIPWLALDSVQDVQVRENLKRFFVEASKEVRRAGHLRSV